MSIQWILFKNIFVFVLFVLVLVICWSYWFVHVFLYMYFCVCSCLHLCYFTYCTTDTHTQKENLPESCSFPVYSLFCEPYVLKTSSSASSFLFFPSLSFFLLHTYPLCPAQAWVSGSYEKPPKPKKKKKEKGWLRRCECCLFSPSLQFLFFFFKKTQASHFL